MERLYCLDFGLLHNIETKHIETKQMNETYRNETDERGEDVTIKGC